MNIQPRFILTRTSSAIKRVLILSTVIPAAFAAGADDPYTDLTTRSSSVEIGAGWINNGNDSSKFGEYNGLDMTNGYGIGNFDLEGGSQFDSNSTERLSIEGTDLGLDTRNLSLDYRKQGSFKVNIDYDELTRNFDNSYQTPYLGAGGNSLILPSNWSIPGMGTATLTNGVLTKGASSLGLAAPAGGSTALTSKLTAAQQATDLGDFQSYKIGTVRKTTGAGFSGELSSRWQLTGSVSQIDQTGTKALGDVSGLGAGETASILPYPIDQTTNQYNLGVNFTGEKAFFQAAYYGSDFINNVPSVNWQSWSVVPGQATPGLTSMSTAPSNLFQQITMTGGYKFSPTTRLIAEGSYGRNTQNTGFLTNTESFSNYVGINNLPESSLHGLVITKDLDLKLLTEPLNKLRITVDAKLKDRDNRTPVNTFNFTDVGAGGSGTLGNASSFGNAEQNNPYSKDLNEFSVKGDYRISNNQSFSLGFVTQGIHRWCEGAWIDCADADNTRENTFKLNYHVTFSDSLSGNIDESISKRRVDYYNQNQWLSLLPGTQPYLSQIGLYGGGYGPAVMPVSNPANPLYNTGANGICGTTAFPNCRVLPNSLYDSENVLSEMPGMQRYYVANENAGKLRFHLNWQATDALAFDGGVDFDNTQYPDATYGLQIMKGTSVNLNASFIATPDLSMNAYVNVETQNSQQEGWAYGNGGITPYSGNSTSAPYSGCPASFASSDAFSWANASAKIDPCTQWQSNVSNRDYVFGFSVVQKNLLADKLDVKADISYINSTVANNMNGNVLQAAIASVPALTYGGYMPAQSLPNITSDTFQMNLSAQYRLDHLSAVKLGYTWARMQTNDYYYSGYQAGGQSQILPTMQQPYAYVVQAVALSYLRSF